MIDKMYYVYMLHPEDGWVKLRQGTKDFCEGFIAAMREYEKVCSENPNFIELRDASHNG